MHTRHTHTTSPCRNTHTSHTRAPTAPRITIQTENQHPLHPLHKHTTYFNTPRLNKLIIFNNGCNTTNISIDPHTIPTCTTDINTNMRYMHTSIVSRHLATIGNNKILCTPPPHISRSEGILPRLTRRTIA